MTENETFFTVVGCMDGRVQEPVMRFGKDTFGAEFPDTITGPGIVGEISNDPSEEFLSGLRKKIDISVERHGSKGIVVDGHAECAGNPVPDEQHKEDIRRATEVIQGMVPGHIYVVGVWVERNSENQWVAEELQSSVTVG